LSALLHRATIKQLDKYNSSLDNTTLLPILDFSSDEHFIFYDQISVLY